LGSLLFLLCAEPETFLNGKASVDGFMKNYFVISEAASNKVFDKDATPASFPNVFKTISEADTVHFEEVFKRVLSNSKIAWAGFLAFIALALLRWRVFVPLAPIIALGLLSFQSSNRFIMFLGPLIGVGLGWLIHLGVDTIFFLIAKIINHREDDEDNKVKKKGSFIFSKALEINVFRWLRQGVLYFGVGGIFMVISSYTAISFVPGPSIHTTIYATFLEVKKRVEKDSALLTWWDYGYAITDATNFATFHDGSSQFGPKTYFIARSLVSSDQKELYDIHIYSA
jgi:hypothetical protein